MSTNEDCPHCIGGYIQTGMGPKPCPYCHATGKKLESNSDNEGNKKPLIDTSDWWHDGSWIIFGLIAFVIIMGLLNGCPTH